jgi:hypothetical protein
VIALQTGDRPVVREGAPQKQDRKFQTATFRQEVISDCSVTWTSTVLYEDYLTFNMCLMKRVSNERIMERPFIPHVWIPKLRI